VSEIRRHVFVFVGPQTRLSEGKELDLTQSLVLFVEKMAGWQLESTMSLPLTTKVKIDTAPDPT
jgi:hypothetical protein